MEYMGYKAADLLALVRELAERYTGRESTSVPYERAQQLMEAVLYCMGQTQEAGNGLVQSREIAGNGNLTAREAYERGYTLVIRRTEEAQRLYNKVIISFNGYGSRIYIDTVTRNIPGFFKWYDARFNPQQVFMGLDYPVPAPLGERQGIERVYRYLVCIQAEQRFLGKLSADYVGAALTASCPDYRELLVNLGEIVLRKILANLLVGISPAEITLAPDRYEALASAIGAVSGEELERRLRELAAGLAARYFSGDEEMAAYLDFYITGIAAELDSGARYGCLQRIL